MSKQLKQVDLKTSSLTQNNHLIEEKFIAQKYLLELQIKEVFEKIQA
jgi:hypothetical protein